MTDERPTPDWLRRLLHMDHRFDPCPVGARNGLEITWEKDAVINPPFSLLREFVQYGRTQPLPQAWIVPHTPDRQWWNLDLVTRECGRVEVLNFHHRIYKGNFGSAIVYLE